VIKGASSWNSGNTWEEKKVPVILIETYLKEKLVGV
jgi:hypothetical protein